MYDRQQDSFSCDQLWEFHNETAYYRNNHMKLVAKAKQPYSAIKKQNKQTKLSKVYEAN